MWTFLASPWIFGSIVAICALIAFIVHRNYRVSILNGKLEAGGNTKAVKQSPHASCPHSKDIMEIIHRTLEYSEKRQELKLKLIESQMKFYEEIQEEIVASFKKIFLSLLADKLVDIDSYVQHPEYTSYVVTLMAISSDIKGYIKNCFKINHYADQSVEEQRDYIERKKSLIIQKVTEMFNMYWRGNVISRSDLYKENYKNIKIFENYLETIFDRAFLLARDTKEELDELESSYKNYISMTVGTDNA